MTMVKDNLLFNCQVDAKMNGSTGGKKPIYELIDNCRKRIRSGAESEKQHQRLHEELQPQKQPAKATSKKIDKSGWLNQAWNVLTLVDDVTFCNCVIPSFSTFFRSKNWQCFRGTTPDPCLCRIHQLLLSFRRILDQGIPSRAWTTSG